MLYKCRNNMIGNVLHKNNIFPKKGQYPKLNFSSHFLFFQSLFMALFNRTNLTFLVIVQGNELAIDSVGLRAFSDQGMLKLFK